MYYIKKAEYKVEGCMIPHISLSFESVVDKSQRFNCNISGGGLGNCFRGMDHSKFFGGSGTIESFGMISFGDKLSILTVNIEPPCSELMSIFRPMFTSTRRKRVHIFLGYIASNEQELLIKNALLDFGFQVNEIRDENQMPEKIRYYY